MTRAVRQRTAQAQEGRVPPPDGWRAHFLLRSRLLVLLPFSFSFFALAAGFLVMHAFRSKLTPGERLDVLAWNQVVSSAGLAIILCAGVSFAAGLYLAQAIRRALLSLGDEFDQTGRFSPDGRCESSGSEIEQLHSHFRRMTQAMNTLVRETGMAATVSVGMDGRVRMVNSLGQLMLGVEPGEVAGKPFQAIFSADGDGKANAAVVEAIEASLGEREPIADRAVEISLAGGRRSEAKLRTSFFTDEGSPQMAIVLLDREMVEKGDVRRLIERAARFLTLGAFATTLAHEIRNPLCSLAGLAELLGESEPDEELKAEFIEHILEGTDRLNRLIEGLMDIASLENCALTPEAPKEIVHDGVGERRHVARSRGIELRVELEEGLPLVNVSREWLARALRNLVDNAIDETPEGGRVAVKAARARVTETIGEKPAQRQYVEFSVHNTGSYIPEARRKKIFEPFETGKQRGMGLGLSIVQEVVQSHGGAVEMTSDPDQGTRFAFRVSAVD